MANPIDNGPRLNGVQVGGSGRAQDPSADKSAASSAASRPAAADAASESARLTRVREQIDSAPEVDMARVEAIKQAIAEGRFPIDPERVAEKFIELEGLLKG